MRGGLRRLPLRVRLVAGFVVAMLTLLTAAGVFVYWRVEYALDRGLDVELDQATSTIGPLVRADGTVSSRSAADASGAAWQVLAPSGAVLDSGGPAPSRRMVPVSDVGRAGSRPLVVEVGSLLPISNKPYRVHLSALPGHAGLVLLVGVRRDHRDEALRELLLQLSLAGLGALFIASLVGERLAWAALRPVERYRRRAAEIADGAKNLRLDVPENRDDEVTRLGHTLNDMLAALEHSIERERQFVDEASHELRTPLTLLKSRIQLARRRPRSVAEHERALAELEVDVARLADLAEQLLALGGPAPADGSADLGALVSSVVESRRAADPEMAEQLHYASTGAGPDARVPMDSQSLERIVTNLIDNGLHHGSPPVEVRVSVRGGYAVLSVSDQGPGMDVELLATATRRFARAPEARSRSGAGLGLSLVEQLVSNAGGELRLCFADHHESHGHPAHLTCQHGPAMTVSVILPLVAEAGAH